MTFEHARNLGLTYVNVAVRAELIIKLYTQLTLVLFSRRHKANDAEL